MRFITSVLLISTFPVYSLAGLVSVSGHIDVDTGFNGLSLTFDSDNTETVFVSDGPNWTLFHPVEYSVSGTNITLDADVKIGVLVDRERGLVNEHFIDDHELNTTFLLSPDDFTSKKIFDGSLLTYEFQTKHPVLFDEIWILETLFVETEPIETELSYWPARVTFDGFTIVQAVSIPEPSGFLMIGLILVGNVIVIARQRWQKSR